MLSRHLETLTNSLESNSELVNAKQTKSQIMTVMRIKKKKKLVITCLLIYLEEITPLDEEAQKLAEHVQSSQYHIFS